MRFVPVTVILELEWVLRASFESERALEVAQKLYRKGSADFAATACT